MAARSPGRSRRAATRSDAAEPLKPVLDACREGDARGRAHYGRLRRSLRRDCGGVEKVIRSLDRERRKRPENKRIAEVSGYLRSPVAAAGRPFMASASKSARPTGAKVGPFSGGAPAIPGDPTDARVA